MRVPFLIALVCLGCASVAQAQTQAPKAPDTTEPVAEKGGLKISISVSSDDDHGDHAILLRPSDPHINVVLQNTSPKPINIFQERDLRAVYNLILKITKVDDKVLDRPLIVPMGMIPRRSWNGSVASIETLAPGETRVREVRLHVPAQIFDPAAPVTSSDLNPRSPFYERFPLPEKEGSRSVTMSAVFANDNSNGHTGVEKKSVWTGKIESAPTDYRVFWG